LFYEKDITFFAEINFEASTYKRGYLRVREADEPVRMQE